MRLLGLAGIFLLLASFGVAQADEPQRESQSESKQKKERNVICRKERKLGSRVPTRICTTKAQRDAAREASQGTIQTMQSRTTRTSAAEG